MTTRQRTISALLGVAICAALIWGLDEAPKSSYYRSEGRVFGTTYSIQYEATAPLDDSITATLQAFDRSLSMFNPVSTLAAINQNRDTVTDPLFEAMWAEAANIYVLSGGAFDITVAPLVNLWGFGTKHRTQNTEHRAQSEIDSIRTFVGFDKVQLIDHHVRKADPRMMVDGGAVAKGQACDVVAAMLERQGCRNYLVEIGGEIVSRGQNSRGDCWHVGITRPVEDNGEGLTANGEGLQEIVSVHDICMATSGNYRNFYYEGEQKRSHTIDPRTGYPVRHSLLSATVISVSCMRADALATACMVVGAEEALRLIQRAGNAQCYLIVAEGDSMRVVTSTGWEAQFKHE